jgi:hypothetical protein
MRNRPNIQRLLDTMHRFQIRQNRAMSSGRINEVEFKRSIKMLYADLDELDIAEFFDWSEE